MPRPSYGAPEVDLHSGRSYFVAGRFFVAVGGQPIEDHWRLRKAKTLVSCSPSRPGIGYIATSSSTLCGQMLKQRRASNNLHQALHAIRRALGAESIALHDEVVRLYPSGGLSVDVDLFEQAAAAARRSSDNTALHDALALWAGPLLPEDQYAGWAEEPRERLPKPMPH